MAGTTVSKLKRSLGIAVAVIAALFVVVIAVVSSIDFNDYRDAVAAEVEAATGRKVAIAGDLDLELGLLPRLAVAGVSLANLPGGSRPEMLRIERLEIEVGLLALLRGQIDVQRLRLVGADLLLEVNKEGRSNWVIGEPSETGAPGKLPIPRDVVIERTTVSFVDGERRRRLRIDRAKWLERGGAPAVLEFSGRIDGLPAFVGDTLPVSGSVSLGLAATGDRAVYSLAAIKARFGDSDVAGSLDIAVGGPRPHVTGNLASDRLSLPGSGRTQSKSGGDSRLIPDAELPLALLHLADGNITYAAKRVDIARLGLDDVKLSLSLQDGVLQLRPASARLAGGALSLTLDLDGTAATPETRFELALKQADLGRLVRETADSKLLRGRFDLHAAGVGRGPTVRATMAGLDGKADMLVTDGYVANRYLELLAADLTGSLAPWSKDAPGAEINCFVTDVRFAQGLGKSRVLMLDTPRMTVAGEGTADLASERLKLRLDPKPKDASLLSLATPVNVTGTFANPVVRPDAVGLATGAAGAVAGNVLLPGVGLLLPLVSAGSDDKHPCLQAVKAAGPAAVPTPTTEQNAAPTEQKSSGGIGGFLKDLGSKIDKTLGVKK